MKDYSRGVPVLSSQSAWRLSITTSRWVSSSEVTEELFLIQIILTCPFKASLYPILQVPLVESQTEIEDSAS